MRVVLLWLNDSTSTCLPCVCALPSTALVRLDPKSDISRYLRTSPRRVQKATIAHLAETIVMDNLGIAVGMIGPMQHKSTSNLELEWRKGELQTPQLSMIGHGQDRHAVRTFCCCSSYHLRLGHP
ncbi:hypothetical protein M438DRAFT_344714 [Aureobasidium pullulans EXF-150]|uniref:Uncharacterized protein n=1 Tax=Aureobasidium pullulans EXF-150 TaxID=1043002 RepID=A0A074XNW2_AURPU|nr:uncharacterized protein M438DRAFT_344714 [Aureobasidium pullulans EXF-150]KEQ85379.1 hypothetical protein M438DRAFT_344714 [Aureobasidium pullulans EXF-150]